MTVGHIFIFVVAGLTIAFFGRQLVSAMSAARHDHEGGLQTTKVVWKLFLGVAGIGFGVAASRYFWLANSAAATRAGAGGLIYMFIVPIVFLCAAGASYALLGWLGAVVGRGGRIGLAALVAAVLWFGLIAPMRDKARIERLEEMAELAALREAQLRQLQAEKQRIPHGPIDTPPEFLAVERQEAGVSLTNLSNDTYQFTVALVLPRGDEIERCQLMVEERNCEPGATCAYQLAKDGSQVPANAISYSGSAFLAPGRTKLFRYRSCMPRFSEAGLEFQVWDARTRTHIYKSESAFLPDSRPPVR